MAFPFPAPCTGAVPDDNVCHLLYKRFDLPWHIQEHCRLVCLVAEEIAAMAIRAGYQVNLPLVRAASLLHDLGKGYALKFGGNHCQLGASWVFAETGNFALAQAVYHHVSWPGELDIENFFLPLLIIYADKRVKHDQLVTLDERFADLLLRYGKTEERRQVMNRSFVQIRNIERLFSKFVKEDLNAYPFNCRRVVK